ncbi:MAG TPA: helix-turn-helix transcriptional regulator [Steroidobacteraceae bacterium]|nr:helix-turn-helix transcriptional regulator [Steroidobacteraceae bacterium]
MKSSEVVEGLAALASEPRLAVFRLLVKRGPEGYTPTEIGERLGVPAPTLSFHLKGLTHAGLVTSRREGRNLYYGPNLAHMRNLVGFLTQNCCSLAGEACDENCVPVAAATRLKHRQRA